MLVGQYCLNLLSVASNIYCGCTCNTGRSELIQGCDKEHHVAPPHVRVYPRNRTVNEGDQATFQCQASGDLLTGIEWLDSRNRRIDTDRRGVLSFRSARVSDTGTYICSASNVFGITVTESVYLTVRGSLNICERTKPCSHNCTVDANNPNRYTCSCPVGFTLGTDRKTCERVGPCERLKPCSHFCSNTKDGGYVCSCPGYMMLKSDRRSCAGICETRNPCSHQCRNTNEGQGYACICPAQYKLSSDQRTCVPMCPQDMMVDPVTGNCISPVCETRKPCSHYCQNTNQAPGFICSCPSQYKLQPDQRTCVPDCPQDTMKDPKTGKCIPVCPRGTVLDEKTNRCVNETPIDVCEKFKPCTELCENVGSHGYRCKCRPGRVLLSDGRNCREVDLRATVNPLVARVEKGKSVQLTCTVTHNYGRGYRGISISWTPQVPDMTVSGGVMTISNANKADHEKLYTCRATDEAGNWDTATGNIYIIDKPKEPEPDTVTVRLTVDPPTVKEGGTATLTCRVSGTAPRSVSITRLDRRALGYNVEVRRTKYEGDTLLIRDVRKANDGRYICRVDGSDETDIATLTVIVLLYSEYEIYGMILKVSTIGDASSANQSVPKEVNVTCGNDVTLFCYNRDGGPMTSVTWKFQDNPVLHNKMTVYGEHLSIPSVDEEDEGIYTCDGTTTHSTTSTFIRVYVVCPPMIEVSINAEDFKVGQEAVLTCNVKGRPNITQVIWKHKTSGVTLATQRSGTPDGRGNELITLTHTIRDLKLTDAGSYECYAENYLNSSSQTVTFSVAPDPPVVRITGQQGNVQQHSSITLTCEVVSGSKTGRMTYDWSFEGAERNTTWPSGVRVVNNRVAIRRVNFDHDGTYFCQVTDSRGQKSNKASAIIFTVGGKIEPPVPRTINGTLYCSLPKGASKIVWSRQDGKPLPTHGRTEGPHDERYIIDPIRPEDAGVYLCCAVNERGSKSSCSTNRPKAPPKVRIDGFRPPYYVNARLALTCVIVLPGWPEATSVQWFHDGEPYTRARGNQIIIPRMNARDEGVYRCVVIHEHMVFATKTVSFECAKPTDLEVSGTEDDGLYALGDIILWTCQAQGDPNPDYNWYKDGRLVSRSAKLILNGVTKRDEGLYSCEAYNTCGGRSSVNATTRLQVKDKPPTKPEIIVEEGSPHRQLPGAALVLRCQATGGYPAPTLSWWFRGAPVRDESSNPAILRFSSFDARHAGDYDCRATNPIGTATTSITINVLCDLKSPKIEKPDQISIGQNYTLRCSSEGSYPQPLIRWKIGGSYYPDSVYRIHMASPLQHDGEYVCEVSNTQCNQLLRASTRIRVTGRKPRVTIEGDRVSSIIYGDTRVFTCTATGDPRPTSVEWRLNNRPIASRNGVLRITDARKEDGGRYTCSARNRHGSDSDGFAIQVITVPPQSIVIDGEGSVEKGNMIDLTCRVVRPTVPRPAVNITWHFKGRMIMQGSRFSGYRMADSMEGDYECRVSNGIDRPLTETKIISMKGRPPPPPTIVPSIYYERVFVGGSSRTEWLCQTEAGARVIWKRQGRSYMPPSFISGNKMRIASAELDDKDVYYCVAENDYGVSEPSRNVTIDVVYREGRVRVEVSPRPNADGKYDEDTRLTFSCIVNGIAAGERRIRWTNSGARISDNAVFSQLVEFIASNSLFNSMTINEREAGEYKCTATHLDGTLIDSATVSIQVSQRICPRGVSINALADDGYVRLGSSLTLVCNYNAQPNPQVTWVRADRRPITHRASGDNLYLTSISEQDMGVYRCQVTVPGCSGVGESSANLQLIVNPVIVRHKPEEPSVTRRESSSLRLECEADGNPTPSIKWRYNGGTRLPAGARVVSEGVLVIDRMQTIYDGRYTCVASHRFSPPSASWTWYIVTDTLQPPTNVQIRRSHNRHLSYGETEFKLTCSADAREVTFVWSYKADGSSTFLSAPFPDTYIYANGLTESVLNFNKLSDTLHNGVYRCEAKNDAGKDSDQVNIEVKTEPSVVLPECKTHGRVICMQSVTSDVDHSLECTAFGKPRLDFFWTRGGAPFGDESVLPLNDVQVSDSNDYICRVSRNGNSISSDIGLYRLFVAVHPTGYSDVDSYSRCTVNGGSSSTIKILTSIIPETGSGLVYLFTSETGMNIRLGLRDYQPYLLLSQPGSSVYRQSSGVTLDTDKFTPIYVEVSSRHVSFKVGNNYPQTDYNVGDYGYTLSARGSMSLMGQSDGSLRGLIGAISALEVNDRLQDIGLCSSHGRQQTSYTRCTADTCGDMGVCVPARTLQGYYCYCKADGLPAFSCNSQGNANRSTITGDSFVQKHFSLIFGRSDYTKFHPITVDSEGYTVNGLLFRSKNLGDSGSDGSGGGGSIGGGSIGGGSSGGISGGSSSGGGSSIGGISGGGSSGGGSSIGGISGGGSSGGGSSIGGISGGGSSGGGSSIGGISGGGSSIGGISGGGSSIGGGGSSSVFRGTFTDGNSGATITGVVNQGGQGGGQGSGQGGGQGSSSGRRTGGGSQYYRYTQTGGGSSGSSSSSGYSPSGYSSVRYSQSGSGLHAGSSSYPAGGTFRSSVARTSFSSQGYQGDGPEYPSRGDLYSTLQNDGQYDSGTDMVEPATESSSSASYKGRGYIRLPKSSFANWLRRGGASFEVTTTSDDGLLFYHGGKEDATMANSEYVALAVQDGFVEMSYRLSRRLQPTRIRSSIKVNDGNRHRVSFTRTKGEATLTVDGVSTSGKHLSPYLAAPGDVYIGGVPDVRMVENLYTDLFTGCIANVRSSSYESQRKEIDLFKMLVKSAGVSEKC